MRLGHYYHVYADGRWHTPVAQHVEALRTSGLLDELEFFRIGIVGSDTNRREVKETLPFAEVVAEAEDGWEQHTLNELYDWALTVPVPHSVLYAHTKGAWSGGELAYLWRVSMTHDTVDNWREVVALLATHDAVGPFWMDSDRHEHLEHKFFFGGNFWWANTHYLRKLPPLRWEHRFQAEGWVGLAEPNVANLRQGPPLFGHFWTP